MEKQEKAMNYFENGCNCSPFGATDCYELIKLDLNKKEDMERAQVKVFGNRCKNMVGKTVELLEKHFFNS